jgi:hypothetical protein
LKVVGWFSGHSGRPKLGVSAAQTRSAASIAAPMIGVLTIPSFLRADQTHNGPVAIETT